MKALSRLIGLELSPLTFALLVAIVGLLCLLLFGRSLWPLFFLAPLAGLFLVLALSIRKGGEG